MDPLLQGISKQLLIVRWSGTQSTSPARSEEQSKRKHAIFKSRGQPVITRVRSIWKAQGTITKNIRSFSSIASIMDRDSLVYSAKLAEQAERFDEMVGNMKEVAKQPQELTVEERNLLSVAYKNVIGSRRASWRVVTSIEQKGADKMEIIKEYKSKIETELVDICNDILSIIDESLIPNSTSEEAKVFYYKMKGDYVSSCHTLLLKCSCYNHFLTICLSTAPLPFRVPNRRHKKGNCRSRP